jgi:LPS export ABC transporter protein LptC/lipopolysaccharide transport protein LptA
MERNLKIVFLTLMRIFCLLAFIIIVCSPGLLYADDPEQKFQGFNLQGYNDSGEKAWNVNGDTADIIGSKIKLFNVDANSFGKQKMNLTAETGILDQVSGNMHLEKDVVVTSERGTRLMTDSLDWHKEADLVKTDDDVLITDEGLTVTGKGMEARPGLKTAQIQENVTVLLDTEAKEQGGKTVTITCDGPLEIDQAQSKATFQENVVAVQENQTLKADKMEIYFDGEKNTIKEMICTGNVIIVQGDNKTFAEKAIYDAVSQKLTLYGRPKLIIVTEGENAITSFGN